MKNFFTKSFCVIAMLFLVAGLSVPAFAQYTDGYIVFGAKVSAIAKDASGNTYVIENPSGSTTGGEIWKYTNGTGAGTMIYNGSYIADNDDASQDNYAFGIVVDSGGNIYFTTDNGQQYTYGDVIKLTYNGGTSYTAAPYITGNATIGYFTGLAIDSGNNLYVLQHDINGDGGDGGFGSYEVAKYAAGSNSVYTVLYDQLKLKSTYSPSDTYSSICALAVDPGGNVYVADWYDTEHPADYGGFIEKLTKSGSTYTASQLLNNAYCSALGCDASGNLYAMTTTAAESVTTLVEFAGGVGSPAALYSNLQGDINYWCFGIAVVGSTIFTSDGYVSGAYGNYMQLVGPPTTQASEISFSNTTPNSTTINWTNGNGGDRAVFMAAASTGTPSPSNYSEYLANTSLGSGGVAGSGWFCVYDGTGTSVNVTNLTQNSTYRVMVLEYNGAAAGLENYLTSASTNNPNNLTRPAAPTLTGSSGSDSYTKGGPAVVVDGAMTATSGLGTLSSATVFISNNFNTGDELTFTNQNGITGAYNGAGGTLMLNGTASVANYQKALESITFYSTSSTASTRTISFQTSDGTSESNTSTKSLVVTTGTTINSIAANSTNSNASSISFAVTFGASITGLSTDNFSLTTSGVSGESIASISGSGTSYTVTVHTGTGNGTIGLNLANASALTPGISTTLPFAGGMTTIDKTPPTVTIGNPSLTDVNSTATVNYSVTWSDANLNSSTISLSSAQVLANLTTTGTATANSVTIGAASGNSATVSFSDVTGNGTIGFMVTSGTAQDYAGNSATASSQSATFAVDNTPPSLTSLFYRSSNSNSNFAKIGDVVTLSFGANEAIKPPTVSIAGHSITATNTGGNNYSASYTMTSGDTEGRIPFTLKVTDLAGNSGNYNDVAAGDLITFDKIPPTATISAPSVATIRTGGARTVNYTVTYADADFNTSNLTNSGIRLNSTGIAEGVVSVAGSGTSYTVTISSITGSGTLGISVGAGYANDLAGNTDAGAGPSATFNVISSDATLSSLSLTGGSLSPRFASGTTSYTVSVNNANDASILRATTNNPNATYAVTVNGNAVDPEKT